MCTIYVMRFTLCDLYDENLTFMLRVVDSFVFGRKRIFMDSRYELGALWDLIRKCNIFNGNIQCSTTLKMFFRILGMKPRNFRTMYKFLYIIRKIRGFTSNIRKNIYSAGSPYGIPWMVYPTYTYRLRVMVCPSLA